MIARVCVLERGILVVVVALRKGGGMRKTRSLSLEELCEEDEAKRKGNQLSRGW